MAADSAMPAPTRCPRPSRRTIMVVGAILIAALLAYGVSRLFASDEPDATGSPAMVRRLTEAQYRASIADIFGEDVGIPGRFERAVRSEGLIAIGTSQAGMSPFAMEQYDASAQAIAASALDERHRGRTAPCLTARDNVFDPDCARSVITNVGLQLFRRPLGEQEAGRYVGIVARAHQQFGSFRQALQLGLYAMLVSPDFLFRVERTVPGAEGAVAALDPYSRAARLSFFLTNSAPDAELLRAAREGELETGRGVRRQVDRLMESPRFEGAVRAFFADMLRFDAFADLSKDPSIYPAFTPAISAEAQEQTLRTISDLLITRRGDYRDLFTTRDTFLTRGLGIIYRMPVSTRQGWEAAAFRPDANRSGIQSHVSFLALHSQPGRSSPTLRGRAIREIFLCQEVPDPPPSVNVSAIEQHVGQANVTARQRIAMHATEPSCAGCHNVMDPLGLTIESFDGIGRWRGTENGAAIDLSGNLDGTSIDSPAGLASALHDHPETPRCLVERMYKAAVGRDITWDERYYLDWLIAGFASDGYRVPDLMRRIATSEHFLTASPAPSGPDHIAWGGRPISEDM